MFGKGRIDPLARQTALAIAAGRIGVGVAALLATDPALRALGFPQPSSTGRALAKLLGARDLTLGALTVAAREDRGVLRAATLTGATLDLADALAFSFAGADPETRRAGAVGVASAAGAALTGLWAWRRL